MDPLEFALGFATFACIADDLEEEERRREREDELSYSGLDATDLSLMDDDERAEALENAGLDPYDYDDFDW